nr:hypothetical protein [uncultured Arsenicibacter sp.]
MKNARVLKLYDLIQELKKTEEVIALHRSLSEDTFMIGQYSAVKDQLFARILSELTSPQLASAVSYQLIRQLIESFYQPLADDMPTKSIDQELLELKALALAA